MTVGELKNLIIQLDQDKEIVMAYGEGEEYYSDIFGEVGKFQDGIYILCPSDIYHKKSGKKLNYDEIRDLG